MKLTFASRDSSAAICLIEIHNGTNAREWLQFTNMDSTRLWGRMTWISDDLGRNLSTWCQGASNDVSYKSFLGG